MFGFSKKSPSTRNLRGERDGYGGGSSSSGGGSADSGSLASSASGTPRGGGRFNPSAFALLSAAEQGLTAELTRLLAMRAGTGGALVVQVNDRDEHGRTALHVAARHGHLDAVKLLVEVHGADLNAVTLPQQQESAQQPSAGGGDADEGRDSLGRKSPLHMALETQRFEVAHYLLAKGATATSVSTSGTTAPSTTVLHLAAANCPQEGEAAVKTFTGARLSSPSFSLPSLSFFSADETRMLFGCRYGGDDHHAAWWGEPSGCAREHCTPLRRVREAATFI
jgi:hypothetical protein